MCLLAFLGNMAVHAYDFDQNGIYYNITDADALTVEVTYVEDGEGNADFYYGAISIPRRISTGGVSYTVTAIGDKAFNNCSDVTSVTIPNTVTSIGNDAFSGCSNLATITLPESVTSIGNSAFNSCSGLTSVTIPYSVTNIGGTPFPKCSGLTSIIVEEGNANYDSRDNCNAIIETATNKLITGCKNTIIPEGITTIGGWSFSFCTELTSINIPKGVTSIEMAAFENCYALASVTIPNSVTIIEGYAFTGCI